MGIKTRFNPMGGRSGEQDLGDLSLWRYSNDVVAGKTLLYNYTGEWYNTENTQMQLNAFFNSYSLFPRNCAYLPSGTTVKAGLRLYTNDGQQATAKILSAVNTNAFTSNVYPNGYGATRLYVRNASVANNFDVAFNIPVVNYNDPITLYVPKARGKAIINDWYDTTSGTTDANRNTPFYNNQNVVDVDLQNVPFMNNSMYNAFMNCRKLKQVDRLPESIINMSYTFYYCINLNQNIQIPNSVTTMAYTFRNCFNLNQNIKIPNSVTNMYGIFYYCNNLNQNIKIPNSVTSMYYTFYSCTNLNQNIQIGNSVTTMYGTFDGCSNLNQNIKIPNSVTSMYWTFNYCTILNQNIQIPNSVTDMGSTFDNCYILNQNIRIPDSVMNMSRTFHNCFWFNQNISNLCRDHQKLTNADYAFHNTRITSAEYCFYNCRNLVNGDAFGNCNSLTIMGYTFYNCTNLNQNIQIPNSVTDVAYTFYNCSNLNQNIQIPNSVWSMYQTFFYCTNLNQNFVNKFNNGYSNLRTVKECLVHTLISDVGDCFHTCAHLIDAWGCFNYCNELTNIGYCFYGCNSLTTNLWFHSTKITGANRPFSNNVSTRTASNPTYIHIYFTYTNGVKTTTWNTFSTALWYYANGKANAKAKNILTNRRNVFVVNLGSASS